MSCLGSDQDHRVHEQRWLQKQIPLPHVGDLSTNCESKPDAWDLLHGKKTLDGEVQSSVFPAKDGVADVLHPEHPLGFAVRDNVIA